MFRYIYRQRRRLLVAGALAALAVALFVGVNVDRIGLDAPAPWVIPATIALTSLICGLIWMAVSVVLCMIRPLRRLAERVPLALAVVGAIAGPELRGPVVVLVFLGLAYLPDAVLWAAERLGLRGRLSARNSFVVPMPMQEVWDRIIPGASGPHWDGALASVTPLEDGQLRLIFRLGQGKHERTQEHIYMVQEATPPTRFAADFSIAYAPRIGAPRGTWAVTLTPDIQTGGTHVTEAISSHDLLPRNAVHGWLDDALGDQTDAMRAALTGTRDTTQLTRALRSKKGQYD